MPYISYEIENIEPLKIGANGNKNNQKEPTKDFIPGNTFRGAIISKIFRNTGEVSDKLLTQVKFYNAYLIEDGNIFFPTPLHLRVDKHKLRAQKVKGESTIEVNNLIDNPDGNKNHLESKFIAVKEAKIEETKGIKGIKAKKTYRLHNSLKKAIDDDKGKSNLFRYEAIDVGHCFKGFIYVPDEETKALVLEALNEMEIVLGGAKTSGYGKCIIDKVEECNISIGERTQENNKLILTCLSDGLFRNEYGLPRNSLETSYLAKYFGEVELEKQFIDTSITEGYNVKWQARLPKETTVKAGSVWVYKMKNPPQNFNEAVQKFEAELHGERQVEGYGWIGVNLYYPNTFILKEEDKEEKVSEDLETGLIAKLERTEKETNLGIIFSAIQEGRSDWIREIAYREIKKLETEEDADKVLVCQLKSTQIRELYEIICSDEISKRAANYIGIRDYVKDKGLFSFYSYNFNELIEYINNDQKDVNIALVNYIEERLSLRSDNKGILPKLYFKNWEGNSSKEADKRLFLKLLIKEILYLLHRMEEEGSASNEK